MPIYKDAIKTSVAKAVKKYGGSIPEEELVRILTAALYDVLSSTEFERYVKELAGKWPAASLTLCSQAGFFSHFSFHHFCQCVEFLS